MLAFLYGQAAIVGKGKDKDKGRKKQTTSQVTAEGGKLDPYVKFYVDPPELLGQSTMSEDMFHNIKMKMPRTAVMNTHWDVAKKEPLMFADDEVPRLQLCLSERAEMEQCHLILAVFDKRRGGKDTLLGQAPISLASYTSGQTIGFQAPLVLHGVVCGSICCNIQTVWPVDDLSLSAW